MRKTGSLRTDGFSVRAGLATSCALRAPTASVVRIHTIRTTEAVLQKDKSGFSKDRRLRADGFIIRAQATIHTDGFSVRAGFGSASTFSPSVQGLPVNIS
jgi:hypothetical protein